MSPAVYRIFDRDGGLLYVGASRKPLDRIDQHKLLSPFGGAIDHVIFTWCDSWADAHELEASEIDTFRPRWNISGRGTRTRWQLSDYVEVLLILGARETPAHGNTVAKSERLCNEIARRWPDVAPAVLEDITPYLPTAA